MRYRVSNFEEIFQFQPISARHFFPGRKKEGFWNEKMRLCSQENWDGANVGRTWLGKELEDRKVWNFFWLEYRLSTEKIDNRFFTKVLSKISFLFSMTSLFDPKVEEYGPGLQLFRSVLTPNKHVMIVRIPNLGIHKGPAEFKTDLI